MNSFRITFYLEGAKMDKKELENTWESFLETREESVKQKLVQHYYEALVKHIARKLAKKFGYKISVDELSSYGIDGLYKAIDAYDNKRDIKFDTYAYSRIWGSMIDGIREEDWVPRSVRFRYSLIEEARQKLESQFGEVPTEDDILKLAKIGKKEYIKNTHKFKPAMISSIEDSINPDVNDNENKKDFNAKLVATNNSTSDSQILRREFLSKLIGKDFTPIERKIVYYHYYENLSMKEIAKQLNLSQSRASQIHQNILERLKKRVKVNPNYFGKEIISIIHKCNDRFSLIL